MHLLNILFEFENLLNATSNYSLSSPCKIKMFEVL